MLRRIGVQMCRGVRSTETLFRYKNATLVVKRKTITSSTENKQNQNLQQMPTLDMAANPPQQIVHFYRRLLPETCVSFGSDEGKKIFAEALSSGHMECYFALAAQFRTQDEPAFCGLSTLVMVLNTLEVDPKKIWKGPWRWYHETMLDCCKQVDDIAKTGINMDQFSCLARCNTLSVQMVRVDEFASEENFRNIIRKETKGLDNVIVASYSRSSLGQTGDGHFSPIGGYHPERDLVLILDTARFKYPPHWVKLKDLWTAMKKLDPDTGLPRGYFKLSTSKNTRLVLFRLTEALSISGSANQSLEENVQDFLSHWNDWLEESVTDGFDIRDVLKQFMLATAEVRGKNGLISTQVDLSCSTVSTEHSCSVKALINALEELPIFTSIKTLLEAENNKSDSRISLAESCHPKESCCLDNLYIEEAHLLTILLLAWPYHNSQTNRGRLLKRHLVEVTANCASELQDEVTQLQEQIKSVLGYMEHCKSCAMTEKCCRENKSC